MLCGLTGVGKSHPENAVAIEALRRDFNVATKPTFHLLYDLKIERASGTYSRNLACILACNLLLLDDFGLQSISPQVASIFTRS